MSTKIGAILFALVVFVAVSKAWIHEENFLSWADKDDVQRQVFMHQIVRFVRGIGSSIIILFGAICLALYLKLRKLERQLEVLSRQRSQQ